LEVDNPKVRENMFASLAHIRTDSLYDVSLRGMAAPRALPIVGGIKGKLASENTFD
jgi:hypothetical protein